MTYYLPDITGQNANYLRQNDIFTLFENGQKIFFNVPIYANSLIITPTNGVNTALVLNTDYQINPEDVDTTTMSRAKNLSSTFSSVLLKSITIIRNNALLPLQTAMTYQEFYATSPVPPVQSGVGTIEFTPSLLIDMLRRISAVEQNVSGVENAASLTTAQAELLPWDINGVMPGNVITGEIHTINTFQNMNVIRPVQGAFFKDSVTLQAGSYTLVYGQDYDVFSFNAAATKLTTDTSGIYNLLWVSYAYSGSISLTYHALGGVVSTQDLTSLYTNQQAVITFLNNSTFLTNASLQDSSSFQTMLNTINTLEGNVRALLAGNPTYGDTTTGTTLVKQIRAQDTQLHWFTIASLYQVAGSTSIITADRMKLHIQLVGAGYMADLDVAVNLASSNYPVTIKATNVIYDPGVTPAGAVENNPSFVPHARVIWNSTQNSVPGILLQLGFPLNNLTDQLAIEDISGVQSCWLLNTTTGTTTAPIIPSDNSVLLPDGVSVWSSTGSSSFSVTQTLQNDTGYVFWFGAKNLTAFDDVSGQTPTLTSTLPSYFRLQDMKSVDVLMQDVNNNPYATRLLLSEFNNDQVGTPIVRLVSGLIPGSATLNSGMLKLVMTNSVGGGASPTTTIHLCGQATINDQMRLTGLILRT